MSYVVPLGTPLGITKLIAEENPEHKSVISEIYNNSLKIILISCTIIPFLIIMFSGQISEFLFSDSKYSSYIIMVGFAVPFLGLQNFYDAYLKGVKNIGLYTKILISASFINLFFAVALSYWLSTEGAVISLFANFIVFSLLSVYFLKKNNLLPRLKLNLRFNKELISKISKISIVFLIAGALHQLTLLIMKKITIDNFGIYGNGLYQSVFNISIYYFGFIFTSLATYSFPKISEIKDSNELNIEINQTLRLIVLLMVPLISFFLVFRDIILVVLYSKDFLSAEPLIRFQLFGDFFKSISWVFGIWLIPKMKLQAFLILDFILNFNLLFFYLIILKFTTITLVGISIAYLVSYFIHFVLNYSVTRKSINFHFTNGNLKGLLISILFVSLVIVVSEFQYFYGYVIILPALILWASVYIRKHEVVKIKEFIIRNRK